MVEREVAEAALRESERRYRNLFDFAPIGLFQATRDGKLLTANQALARILDYNDAGELLGKSMSEEIYFSREDRDDALTRSGPIGRSTSVDVRLRRRDGEPVWVQLNTHAVQDGAGRTLFFEGFVSDLTERKRAERLQEVRFAVTRSIAEAWSLQEAGPRVLESLCAGLSWPLGILWAAHPTTHLLVFVASWRSRAMPVSVLETSSRTLSFARGQGLLGRVFGVGSPDWAQDMTTDPRFLRSAMAREDGLRRWCAFPILSGNDVLGVVELMAPEAGPPDGDLLRVMADLGSQIGQFWQRSRVEEERRSIEERYRQLFERNLAGVYRATRDGRLLECNTAFARIHGYASREELLGADVRRLHPDPVAREELLARLDRAGAVTSQETSGRRKDGSAVWLLENVSLVFGAEGHASLVEGMVIDVTDRKQLEEQLRQSQKMEAIGRLAGGIAHDFNNLLTAILGFSGLALNQLAPDDPLVTNVAEIRKAGERAAALTRQLLAFSRRQILAPVVLDINSAVRSMEKMLRRLIGDDVEVVARLDPELGRVRVDPGQIEQVVVNLVVNSRDAMPEGGRLAIDTDNVTFSEAHARELGIAAGAYVMLSVSDTGVGMDDEVRSHMFEPFFTTKPRGRGTGLGLPTVYGIVKQSGGHVTVESAVGRGTTFRIYLPRVDAEAESPAVVAENAGSYRGTETVLLVENEDSVRLFLREALQRNGYRVLEARHGGEAVEVATRFLGRIDILVTDVVMPVMGGRDLARKIVWSRPEIQVLYISGFTDGSIVRDGGVLPRETAFLAKPFTQETLLGRVRELLDRGAEKT